MQIFTYSFFYRIIFTLGNIIVTVLLSLQIIPIVFYLDQNLWLLLPLAIALIIIYIINKSYFVYYKILPFKIEADEEKMICSNFIFSNKVITIRYEDIESLGGGIFDGKPSGILKVNDGRNKLRIGFSQKINNSSKLISLILSKVSKDLYNQVIEHITEKRRGKAPAKK
ncbi:MAG: hypothetical protein P8Y79_01805 [Ignavibacteriaceae bacterium]